MSTSIAEDGVAHAAAATRPPVPRWHIHRRLYDWVLSWAETRYGPVALFLIAFAESSFFPIPPDVLLIPLVIGNRKKSFRFALICTVGSVLGGLAGYAIGLWVMEAVGNRIIEFYHAQKYLEQVMAWYAEYNYWIVFIAAFTPIPYKVFTIASGVFGMSIVPFMLVSAVGRGGRFFLVSTLLYWFGPPIKRTIDRYFNLACVLFVVLLIAGFAVIRLVR